MEASFMAIWLHDYSARRFFSLLLASLSLPSFSLTPPSENSGRQTGRCFIHPGATSGMFPPGASSRPCWKNCVRHANFPRIWLRRISPPGGKSPESHATTDEIPPPGGYPRPRSGKNRAKRTLPGGKWEAYPFPGAAVPFLVLLPDNASDKIRFPCYSAFPGQTRPRKSWRGKHHRIWTSLPYSSRATTPWLSIMSGRDGRPLWWTMPERVKKETRNTPQAVLHTIMKTWPASCWKWTGAGWATPPTRTNVFWIG